MKILKFNEFIEANKEELLNKKICEIFKEYQNYIGALGSQLKDLMFFHGWVGAKHKANNVYFSDLSKAQRCYDEYMSSRSKQDIDNVSYFIGYMRRSDIFNGPNSYFMHEIDRIYPNKDKNEDYLSEYTIDKYHKKTSYHKGPTVCSSRHKKVSTKEEEMQQ